MEKIIATDITQPQLTLLQEMRQITAAAEQQEIMPASHEAGLNNVAGIPSFGQILNQAIDHVNQLQNSASDKQTAYDMRLNDDLATTMLESQKASVAFSALLQTRNKLTGALDELINMPL